ncbi:MAG: hypothetical protein Q9201_001088 [Fulgogasparrea decipioides]
MVTNVEEYTIDGGAVKTAMLADHESYTTFTLTGPTTYTTIYTQAFRPGRVWQAYYPDNYMCCMNCYVYFPQVEVFYWPVPESEETCANGSEPIVTAQAILPTGAARTAEARLHSLYSNSSVTGVVSTVNADGFTFISPSVYVAFGDVSAGDACGAVGQKHTSITLGFAPGELQTVTALGKDHYDTTLGTRAFDPKNVLCPPDFEPERLFVQQDSLAGTHTYRPRIQIPPALQNLDPKWSSCIVDPYEGIDPPRQLVPASGFEDGPVATTSVAPVQQPTPAAVAPSLPEKTGHGDEGDPGMSPPPLDPQIDPRPDAGSPDPQPRPTQGSFGGAGTGLNNGGDPPKQPNFQPASPQDPEQPSAGGNEQGQNGQNGISNPTKATNPQAQPAANLPHVDPPKPAQPAVVVQGQTIKQGAEPVIIDGKPVIYSKGSVYVGGAAAPAPTAGQAPRPDNQPAPKPSPVVFGGFKFTPVQQGNSAENPAQGRPAVVVQGQTIHQDAPPTTINGHEVVYSGGSVHVGGKTVPVKPVQPGLPAEPKVVQGMTFTPVAAAPAANNDAADPKPAVVVQGQTLHQDAPPTTINGQAVVYSGGSLTIGGTAIPIAPAKPNQPPKAVAVQGLTFTPIAAPPSRGADSQNHIEPPSHPVIIVKGQTITENGPAATINGKPVVYSGGAVYVGGTRAAIPTTKIGQQPPNPVSAAGMVFTPQPVQAGHGGGPAPAVVVAGHTLTEGAPAVSVNGARLAYSSGSVYVNAKAAPLPTSPPLQIGQQTDQAPVVVVNGLTVYAAPSANQKHPVQAPITTIAGHIISSLPSGGGILIDGTTLIPGFPAVTVSGTAISLNPSALVLGTKTIPIPSLLPQPIATLTGGETIYRNVDGSAVVGDTTLLPGGPAVTIGRTRYSLASTALVVGTKTLPFSPPTLSIPSTIPPPPATTLFGQTITANAEGAYVIAGKTVMPDGAAVTVSGSVISLGHIGGKTKGGAEVLVVGGSTRTISGSTGSAKVTQSAKQENGEFSAATVMGPSGDRAEPTGTAGAGEGSATGVPDSSAANGRQEDKIGWWAVVGMILVFVNWG